MDFMLNYVVISMTNSLPCILAMLCVVNADDCPHILSAITNLKDRLADIIEPDFGLLDELLRLEVLSRRQYNKVRSGDKAAYERSDALLDLLITEDHCVKFLEALQRTGQQHVTNLITQNGGEKLNLETTCFRKFLPLFIEN